MSSQAQETGSAESPKSYIDFERLEELSRREWYSVNDTSHGTFNRSEEGETVYVRDNYNNNPFGDERFQYQLIYVEKGPRGETETIGGFDKKGEIEKVQNRLT